MNLLLKFKKNYIYLLLILFFIINILFLTSFPFVHSDESWLSGLSRTFLETGHMNYLFFDIYPTAHHTMKIVFILIQNLFINFLGYSIFSVRLVSLLFSILSLYFFNKIIYYYSNDYFISFLTTLLFALNLQFILISHIARQESPLVFLFIFAYYLLIKNYKHTNLTLSLILGIGIGIHPNIIFLALSLGFVYIFQIIKKEKKIIDLIKLVSFTTFFSLIYILSTFKINKNFISEYNNFGNPLGISNTIINKINGFYNFYYKLFHQISGTYFLNNLKLDYFLFIILIAIIALVIYKKNELNSNYFFPIIFIVCINLGIIIIGRYNQISVIFPLVFLYLGFGIFISNFTSKKNYIYLFLMFLILIQSFNTITFIKNIDNENYNTYLENFSIIADNATVLGNLNLEYKFKDHLFDYRNLYYLKDNNISIDKYIENNNINYIIWYEEMDYIYRNSPKWDALYGNLYYYESIKDFFITKCTIEKEFESPTYAMRISKYVNTYPWKVTIYKVKANIE
jgi:hypothetical protein